MTAEILPGGDRQQTWIVLSKTKGGMDPRIWLKTFGIFESAEAALASVSQRTKTDVQFRRRAKGQQFFPARIDWLLEVGADMGVLVRYRNEVAPWS